MELSRKMKNMTSQKLFRLNTFYCTTHLITLHTLLHNTLKHYKVAQADTSYTLLLPCLLDLPGPFLQCLPHLAKHNGSSNFLFYCWRNKSIFPQALDPRLDPSNTLDNMVYMMGQEVYKLTGIAIAPVNNS
jgi:hypothetical protein